MHIYVNEMYAYVLVCITLWLVSAFFLKNIILTRSLKCYSFTKNKEYSLISIHLLKFDNLSDIQAGLPRDTIGSFFPNRTHPNKNSGALIVNFQKPK